MCHHHWRSRLLLLCGVDVGELPASERPLKQAHARTQWLKWWEFTPRIYLLSSKTDMRNISEASDSTPAVCKPQRPRNRKTKDRKTDIEEKQISIILPLMKWAERDSQKVHVLKHWFPVGGSNHWLSLMHEHSDFLSGLIHSFIES